MLGTFIAVIAAIFFTLAPTGAQSLHDFQPIYWVLTLVGTLFLYIALSAKKAAWENLQRAGEESLPYAQELFLKDWWLFLSLLVLFTFALFSYLLVFLEAIGLDGMKMHYLLLVWVVFTGLSFDVMQFGSRRMMHYSYYPFLLEKVVKQCLKAVAEAKEVEAFEWLDAVIEVISKATKNGSSHVASDALDKMLVIVEGYVGAASTSMRSDPFESSKTSLLDRVNYLAVYMCKRLEWLFQSALRENMNPVADEVIGVYGKMSLYFAKYHPTLAHLPLLFIQKCAKIALDADIGESSKEDAIVQISATVSELTKNYILLAKERGESFQEITFIALSHLEEIAKATFQKNKEMNPALLMQPFAEIGQLIGDERFLVFPARDEILVELKRILSQFNALDLVKKKSASLG